MKQIELELFTADLRMMQFAPIDVENNEVIDLLRNSVIEDENDVPVDEGVERYDSEVYDDITDLNSENNETCDREVYLTDGYNAYTCLTVTDEDGNTAEYEDIIAEKNGRNIGRNISSGDYVELFDGDIDSDDAKEIAERFADDYKMEASEVVKIHNTETYEYDDSYHYTELLRRLKEKDPTLQSTPLIRIHVESLLNDCEISENYDAVLLRSSIIGKGSVRYQIELEEDEEFDINKLHFICEGDWWDDDFVDIEGLSYIFESSDLMLDFIIYDGKFIPRYGDASWCGIRAFGNTVLMNHDMTKYE